MLVRDYYTSPDTAAAFFCKTRGVKTTVYLQSNSFELP